MAAMSEPQLTLSYQQKTEPDVRGRRGGVGGGGPGGGGGRLFWFFDVGVGRGGGGGAWVGGAGGVGGLVVDVSICGWADAGERRLWGCAAAVWGGDVDGGDLHVDERVRAGGGGVVRGGQEAAGGGGQAGGAAGAGGGDGDCVVVFW